MTFRFLRWIFVCALLVAPALAVADQTDLFGQLDENNDGLISKEEVGDDVQTLYQRLLRTADADDDGKISRDEFVAGTTAPAPQKGPEGSAEPRNRSRKLDPARMFKRLDQNADGILTRQEVPKRFLQRFDQIDSDGSGEVKLDEFKKSIGKNGPRGKKSKESTKAPPGRSPKAGRGPKAGQGPKGGKSLRAVGHGKIIEVLDTNADGQLSAEEIAAASSSLAKLDKDNNGSISRKEWMGDRPHLQDRAKLARGEFRLKRLMESDQDGDGKISLEEAPEPLKKMIGKLDSDGDGLLSKEELKKLVSDRSVRKIGRKRKQNK